MGFDVLTPLVIEVSGRVLYCLIVAFVQLREGIVLTAVLLDKLGFLNTVPLNSLTFLVVVTLNKLVFFVLVS